MDLYEPANPLSMPFECFHYNSVTLPFPINPHRHYFAELILNRKGELLLTCDDQKFTLHEGESYFIYPHVTHSIHCEPGESIAYDVIKMDIHQFDDSPDYAPEMRAIIADVARRNMPAFFSRAVVDQLGLSDRMSACINEVEKHVYGYDLVVRSVLNIIMTQMLRYWMSIGYTVDHRVLQSDLLDSIDSVTSYIESHLHETLKVEQLAEQCNMSYPAFARRFRQLYGISCKEYIEQVRIARVEHYLRFTDCELNYISQETGYTDCSHMIRDFRRLRGTTPGRYRAESRS